MLLLVFVICTPAFAVVVPASISGITSDMLYHLPSALPNSKPNNLSEISVNFYLFNIILSSGQPI